MGVLYGRRRAPRSNGAARACCQHGTTASSPSGAAEPHPTVVASNASEFPPQLVPDAGVAHPKAHAVEQTRGTVYVGGRFDRVSQGGHIYERRNLLAFGASTGALTNVQTRLDDGFWDIAAEGFSVYVGGSFRTAYRVERRGLVKLDASTGRVIRSTNKRLLPTQPRRLHETATGPRAARLGCRHDEVPAGLRVG